MLNVRTLRLSETLIQRLHGRTADVPLGMADGIPGNKTTKDLSVNRRSIQQQFRQLWIIQTALIPLLRGKKQLFVDLQLFLLRKETLPGGKVKKTGHQPAAQQWIVKGSNNSHLEGHIDNWMLAADAWPWQQCEAMVSFQGSSQTGEPLVTYDHGVGQWKQLL